MSACGKPVEAFGTMMGYRCEAPLGHDGPHVSSELPATQRAREKWEAEQATGEAEQRGHDRWQRERPEPRISEGQWVDLPASSSAEEVIVALAQLEISLGRLTQNLGDVLRSVQQVSKALRDG